MQISVSTFFYFLKDNVVLYRSSNYKEQNFERRMYLMDLNMGEVLKESLINGFVTVVNTPMPIGGITIPLWILLLGILFLITLVKKLTKTRA